MSVLTRRIQALVCLLLLTAATQGSTAYAGYASYVLGDNPLGYWQLGDGGSTYADSTGNGNNGSENNGAVSDVSGIVSGISGNGAVAFPGTAGRIVVPGFEKIGTGYTVEYWLKINSLPGNFTNLVGDGEGGGDFFLMNYLSSGGKVRPHYGTGNTPVSMDSNATLVPGQTYHIVTTWDSTTGTNNGKIWINGVLDKQINVTTNVPAPGTTGNNILFIGDDNREAPLGNFVLDEVAVYNYPLSKGQITDHAVLGGARSISTVLSTDVLGPGTYGNGYNNNAGNSTVELVRFIPNSDSAPLNVDYNTNGNTIDLSNYVVSGATAGNLGSNVHGRGSQLFLPGDGETLPPPASNNNGGIGLGAHANWLITFDLNDIRSVHMDDTSLPLLLTGRFGMNGQGGVGESVNSGGLVQGLVYLDGVQIFASGLKSTLTPSDAINLTMSSGRWLTFVIANGNASSFYDDGTFRDLRLTVVPEPGSTALVMFGAAAVWCIARLGRRK